jgi:hypothetical protein
MSERRAIGRVWHRVIIRAHAQLSAVARSANVSAVRARQGLRNRFEPDQRPGRTVSLKSHNAGAAAGGLIVTLGLCPSYSVPIVPIERWRVGARPSPDLIWDQWWL